MLYVAIGWFLGLNEQLLITCHGGVADSSCDGVVADSGHHVAYFPVVLPDLPKSTQTSDDITRCSRTLNVIQVIFDYTISTVTISIVFTCVKMCQYI